MMMPMIIGTINLSKLDFKLKMGDILQIFQPFYKSIQTGF